MQRRLLFAHWKVSYILRIESVHTTCDPRIASLDMRTSILLSRWLPAVFSALFASALIAQTNTGYNQPDKPILDVMHAPEPPRPFVSPTENNILLVAEQQYPSIDRVAAPFLRLGGVRVEPANHSKHDTPGGYGITPCASSYEVVHIADSKTVPVTLPTGSCAGPPSWSADGKLFAFANITATSVGLWIGDAVTGIIHQIPGVALNPMFGDDFQWLGGTHTLLVKLVPAGLAPIPTTPAAVSGPGIQESIGGKGASSTYEVRDTLTNKHDEDLFDYFADSQLALVDAATAAVDPIGKPANFFEIATAPDARHILLSYIHRPYSYITTYDHFPKNVEVWDIGDPRAFASHTLFNLPLADRVPIHGVPTGPRDFSWRLTDPATLIWAEALDGGDWNQTVPNRDKVMLLKAPFTDQPKEIERTAQRYDGFLWSEKPTAALLYQEDENRHWLHVDVVNIDDLSQKPRTLWDLSYDDSYANPGSPVTRHLPNGVSVMRVEGDSIFLSGRGASPEGLRPFLDRLNLSTGKSERLFRSDRSSLEVFLSFPEGSDTRRFLTWHQSPTDPPNAFLRTLGNSVTASAGEATLASAAAPVTHIPDYTPAVRAIKKRLVRYKRADGLDLSFTLYTPPGYQEGIRVPTILYAYPLDYASASQAGQVTGSDQTFTRLFEYQFLLLAGYAILDNTSFPIVGDPKKAYDTYLDQLVADANAAIAEGVRIGVVDPDRVGVTGHSHGALMTANLIAHTDLFKAGAATSGSYNKSLTPFGFQNERRSVWEATDTYLKVSPFFYADKIKHPLLIVHGEEDANPGTTPIQAKLLYEAIRGNGGTARLVMLPHEPHWYTAMESNEQLVYEMIRWFDTYVKKAPSHESSKQ
jgi:dipeptidyl aminopeptidase/acylaminoacyl peptidase